MSARATIRVLVLDGLDWTWCSTHRDLVPNLWALAAEGCAAPLRACTRPVTSQGVAALLAGREVDVPWAQGDDYATSQELIRTRPWVYELARHGLSLGMLNVPLTWPAFPLPAGCWCVSGFPVDQIALQNPRVPWHWPRGLDVLGYPIEAVVCDHGPGGTKDILGLSDAEDEMVHWLDRADRRDTEIVWLRSTDGAGHHHWGTPLYDEAMRRADARVPRIREGCENLVVVSDHGFDALTSPRCGPYLATNHGPTARQYGLVGGHAMEGVLFAAGDRVRARGELAEQKLVEVAGGLFDLLQRPPAPGMVTMGPAWARAVPAGSSEAERIAERMRRLGYL